MRHQFQCVGCALVVAGRVHDGHIFADDRSATDDDEPQPFCCAQCGESEETP